MTRALRARHRLLLSCLAVLLPAGFAASIAVRPRPPAPEHLPLSLGERPALDCAVALADDAWGELPLRARAGSPRGGAGRFVELRAGAPIRLPDLLLYWRPAGAGDGLDRAVLLGSFAGRLTAPLPEEARAGGGTLLLYSLGHAAVAGSAALPLLPQEIPCR